MKSFARKVYQRVGLLGLSFVLAFSALSGVGTLLLSQTASAISPSEVVYDALPSDNPTNTNYVSLGYEATSTSQFGDYVHLGGTNRILNTATVTMSDWAKYSDYSSNATYSGNSSTWSMPVTLNIYSNHLAGGVPDTLLATKTQTFNIPWRPESDPTCGSTSNGNGWKVGGICYNFSGIASNITFDLSSLNVTLPSDVIVGVAYNTQNYGASPTHVAGPYNSLNVAVPTGQVASVGSDDNADNVYLNSTWGGAYSDSGSAGTGIFRQDAGWSPYGTVAFELTATAPVAPAAPTGLQFKNGSTVIASGSTFHNTTTTNNTDLEWSNGSSESADAYQTLITYPDGTTSTQWTSTRNLWIGQTAYVNNYFGQKGDGVYSYQVKERSASTGLWSDWSSTVSLNYDTHSPTAQFTITPPQYVNGNFHVSGTANDNVALSNVFFDVRDSSGWVAGCTSGSTSLVYDTDHKNATISCDINTANLVDGQSYTLRIHASDYAGYGGGQSVTITVDRTAPTGLQNLSPSDGAYATTATQTSIDWTDASDASTPVSYYYESSHSSAVNLDGSFTSPVYQSSALSTSTIPTPGTPEGVYYWHVRAVDALGNSTAWTSPWKITIDNTAPVVAITSQSNGDVLRGSVTVSGTVTDANPDHYYFVVKDSHGHVVAGPGTVYQASVSNWTWNTTTVADGNYTIDLEARDAANNKDASSVKTVSVTVDNTAPVVTVDGSSATTSTPTITGTVDDTAAVVTLSVDGGAPVTATNNGDGTWSYTFTSPLADGTYTIEATATDAAGNPSTPASANLTVNTTPAVPATNTTPGTPATTTATVTPTNTNTNNAANQGVLGASTTNPAADNTGVKGATDTAAATTDAASTSGAGLAWYWWALIIAALAGIIWAIIAAIRRRNQEA